MDIELLRTFLEVDRARHFGRAAQQLCLTPSAVSARIRLLEDTIGVPLFVRSRNNIQLTPEGMRLKKHAETIVNAWARARQETILQEDYSDALAIGALWDLWEAFLNRWFAAIARGLPGIALLLESHTSEVLMRKLIDGVLDLAVVFEPLQAPDLEIRELAGIRLVMVSTRKGQSVAAALAQGYIMVDWGNTFNASHARLFPDLPTPVIRTNLGALALRYLLNNGGSAYLPEESLAERQVSGRLFRVKEAPVIERSVYALYRAGSDREPLIGKALSLARTLE